MIAFLSGFFSLLFSNGVAWFLALKVLLGILIMTILPIVLTNFFASIVEGLITLTEEHSGSVSSVALSLTGLAGWLAGQLGLPAAFAVLFSALAVKFSLKLIPFVRL